VSFQSRIGPGWLKPFSDIELKELPKRGKKNIAVVCPAFIADNLETLEEMDIRGRETFMEAGGESFTYIPCLNSDDSFIDFLSSI
jgi:ferrochelatase